MSSIEKELEEAKQQISDYNYILKPYSDQLGRIRETLEFIDKQIDNNEIDEVKAGMKLLNKQFDHLDKIREVLKKIEDANYEVFRESIFKNNKSNSYKSFLNACKTFLNKN